MNLVWGQGHNNVGHGVMFPYTSQEQIVDVRTVGSNVDLPEAGFEGLAQVRMYMFLPSLDMKFNSLAGSAKY